MDQKEASMVFSWIWYSSNLICVFIPLLQLLDWNYTTRLENNHIKSQTKNDPTYMFNLSFETALVSMNNQTENGKAVTLDSRNVICVLVAFRIKGQAMKLF